MSTEALVDTLRKTLIRHGHIIPTNTQRDSKLVTLNQGEYLVSLLSHDESLLICLNALENCDFTHETLKSLRREGSAEQGYLLAGNFGENFDLYVDVVKFVWLLHGTSTALELIKSSGFTEWTQHPLTQRSKYVDSLVLIAQKKLRQAGMKFSDMAEFFADARSVKVLMDRNRKIERRVARDNKLPAILKSDLLH